MMGDTGPMGPCTEIHYFMDGDADAALADAGSGERGRAGSRSGTSCSCSSSGATPGGELFTLPAPSIDTGAGLERVTCGRAGRASNYDTDLFTGIIATAARARGQDATAHDPRRDTSMRVIADHARCSAFLIADGVFPDKTGREYVLRRIFRRAVRHGKLLGIERAVHARGLHDGRSRRWARSTPSSSSASTTIDAGRARGGEAVPRDARARPQAARRGVRPAAQDRRQAGLGQGRVHALRHVRVPDDLTEIIANERGFGVDKAGFEQEMAKAQELSKFGGSDQDAVSGDIKALAERGRRDPVPRLRGPRHDRRGRGQGDPRRRQARRRARRPGTRVQLVFDQTPFYGESGGQIGDTGEVSTAGARRSRSTDTKKPAGDVHVLVGEVEAGAISGRRPGRRSRSTTSAASGSAPTTRRPTSCTTRSSTCSATTSRRRARSSRPTACASTSRTSRR